MYELNVFIHFKFILGGFFYLKIFNFTTSSGGLLSLKATMKNALDFGAFLLVFRRLI